MTDEEISKLATKIAELMPKRESIRHPLTPHSPIPYYRPIWVAPVWPWYSDPYYYRHRHTVTY